MFTKPGWPLKKNILTINYVGLTHEGTYQCLREDNDHFVFIAEAQLSIESMNY